MHIQYSSKKKRESEKIKTKWKIECFQNEGYYSLVLLLVAYIESVYSRTKNLQPFTLVAIQVRIEKKSVKGRSSLAKWLGQRVLDIEAQTYSWGHTMSIQSRTSTASHYFDWPENFLSIFVVGLIIQSMIIRSSRIQAALEERATAEQWLFDQEYRLIRRPFLNAKFKRVFLPQWNGTNLGNFECKLRVCSQKV